MFTLMRFLQLNAIVGPYPNQILDGQLIDAVPVMQDFEWVRSQVNANVPSLIGSNTFVPTGSVGGSANAITLAPSPIISAYAQGQTFTFQAIASNTGNTTISTSGLGARTVQTAFGTTLSGGEIVNGGIYTVTDSGSVYVLMNAAQGSGLVTFSPTITFGNAAVGATYSLQSGIGFKLNNIFFFCASVTLSAKGASTGAIGLANFPYAVKTTWVDGVFPLFCANLTLAGGNYAVGYPDPGSNVMRVIEITSGGAVTVLTDTQCTNTTNIAMQGFYPV